MHSTCSVFTSPSMPIIQGAYQSFCTPFEHETVYDSETMIVQLDEFMADMIVAASVVNWVLFLGLVKKWKTERGVASSITEAAMCPAYQSIIGMGQTVVPLILLQLEDEGDDPDQWFWALRAITGADPVRDGDRGNYAKMARAWIEWRARE